MNRCDIKTLVKAIIVATTIISSACGTAFLMWWLNTGSLVALGICLGLIWIFAVIIFYRIEKGGLKNGKYDKRV